MTKEEQWIKGSIENYIFAYTGKRAKISDADAQHFTASVMSYLNLCTLSLPSNLDEAAERMASDIAPDYPDISWDTCYEKIKEGIKAGAEWMAGQGETHEAKIIESVPFGGTKWKRCVKVWLDDQFQAKGDKVVVQIRKK